MKVGDAVQITGNDSKGCTDAWGYYGTIEGTGIVGDASEMDSELSDLFKVKVEFDREKYEIRNFPEDSLGLIKPD